MTNKDIARMVKFQMTSIFSKHRGKILIKKTNFEQWQPYSKNGASSLPPFQLKMKKVLKVNICYSKKSTLTVKNT